MNTAQYAKDKSKTLAEKMLAASQYIASCQRPDGAILWFANGKLDPWDHTEAAMGLAISGDINAAKKAFLWLIENQNSDGSWYAHYYGDNSDDNNTLDRFKIETNFVAYIATGVWHFYLISKDIDFCQKIYHTVEKAINYVVAHQREEGDIQWASSTKETLPQDALITANASILRSLECGIRLSELLNISQSKWRYALAQLANTLKHKPWRFDRTWESKERFSMDWFYPILSGIYSPDEAKQKLIDRWEIFVEPNLGCRCVSDQPWMTVAESCELALALVASGQKEKAKVIHEQLFRWQDSDGGFWTGYNFKNRNIWPLEKTSWTAGAFILAADAIYNITPASGILTSTSSALEFIQEPLGGTGSEQYTMAENKVRLAEKNTS